jgi:hypothetical protein
MSRLLWRLCAHQGNKRRCRRGVNSRLRSAHARPADPAKQGHRRTLISLPSRETQGEILSAVKKHIKFQIHISNFDAFLTLRQGKFRQFFDARIQDAWFPLKNAIITL